MITVTNRISLFLAYGIALLRARPVKGHGYLATPRSRNLYAFDEKNWGSRTEDDPQPETCPQCLNLGGSRARCGIADQRNYDAPKNALGRLMKTNIQATYSQGQEVLIEVILTAHHKGHFVFSACPIVYGEVPTQDCFDRHQLTFVKDMTNDANFDPNYPERAYLAPASYKGEAKGDGNYGYSYKMQLPSSVFGDLVLIQWYYLTANSCIHEGYEEYNWPVGWDYGTAAGQCGQLSNDGVGGAEQFWNCAEVKINRGRETNNGHNKPDKIKDKPASNAGNKEKPDKIKDKPAPGDEKKPGKKKDKPAGKKKDKPAGKKKDKPARKKKDKPDKKGRTGSNHHKTHARITPRIRRDRRSSNHRKLRVNRSSSLATINS